ncbi:glycerate kinase [Sanguibacter suaedae]|uniref:Glycerate kinase n=1 Tax=Sanguibacter suaedae TaxID=2795737 RepID=A0A934IAD3_9MICO|nr:glycerate kinase [Sanguibacter suaedae]MBI9114261.1 glycerate kinase [Sanguibacter suaedae]
MHVLVAADAFGALTALDAARALADGWMVGAPHDTVEAIGLPDGGEGLVPTLAAALGADVPEGEVLVVGHGASKVAYVSGRVPPGSWGEVLAGRLSVALAARAGRIVVGLGPDIEVPDGGAGLLAALGAVPRGLHPDAALDSLGERDLAGLGTARGLFDPVDLVVATGSDVPLLGLHGASATSARAGLVTDEAAHALERALGGFAHVVQAAVDAGAGPRLTLAQAGRAGTRPRPLAGLAGSGAGGGTAFALAALGARILPAAPVFAEALGLVARAERADLVLTGTGALDGGTFGGSVAVSASRAAAAWGLPCVALVTSAAMGRRESAAEGLSAVYVVEPGGRGAVGAPELGRAADRMSRTWSPARVHGALEVAPDRSGETRRTRA